MFDHMHKLQHEFKELVQGAEHKVHHKLDQILKRINHMSQEMDTLTAQVKANSDLLDSATTLINGIADRITAAGADPVKLQSLSQELKSKDDVLAASIVANTPAKTL